MAHLSNEISLLQKCDHPNIIRLITSFEGQRKIYLILEYVGPLTLAQYLDKKKTVMDEDEAAHVFYEILQGLLYLHNRNIFHRDIKLHNIIVGSQGEVKLIDLGYALETHVEPRHVKTFCGTPSYMPPEVVSRDPYDPEKSDIWSLAVCLYKSLCGKFPFVGVSQTNLFYHIRRG